LLLLLAGLGAAAAGYAVLAGSYLAAALAAGRTAPAPLPRWERRLAVLMVFAGMAALAPPILREWVRERSDAVFHGAVAMEIRARGLPPGDPMFAGIRLNYIWFYHSLLAVWSAALRTAPWNLAGALDAAWMVSIPAAVYSFSRRVRRPGREAFFAALFVPLGLGALFTLWLPLKVARGLFGATAGPEHLAHLLSLRPFTVDRVIEVASTFGSVPPFFNKFWVMTAFGGAIASLLWLLEALAGSIRAGRLASRRPAPLIMMAAFGCWVLHPVVGLVATLALALAGGALLLAPGGISRGAIGRGAVAAALGTAAGLVLVAATAGRAESPVPLGFDPRGALAVVTSSTAALLLGIPALLRLRSGAATRFVRVAAVAFAAASLVVVLPPPNTADKMAYTFYLLPAIAAGWTLGRWWAALARRGRRGLARVGLVFLLAPATGLFGAALLAEKPPASPSAEERDLYAWLGRETPPETIVLDTAGRVEVTVRVPRRQYWGRELYSRLWGYDPEEMERRREVRNALAGRDIRWEDLYAPRAIAAVARLGLFSRARRWPVLVLWRRPDHGGTGSSAGGPLPPGLRLAWENESVSVYRVEVPGRRRGSD